MIKSSGEGHRFVGAIAIGLAALALSTQANAQIKKPIQSIGGTLTLKDEGTFYVHGKKVSTQFSGATAPGAPLPAPATIMIEQMYVHYRIPAKVTNYPIVFVHGGGLTGQAYETTPDGREGWATYFARKGFPTYVVDFPFAGPSSSLIIALASNNKAPNRAECPLGSSIPVIDPPSTNKGRRAVISSAILESSSLICFAPTSEISSHG